MKDLDHIKTAQDLIDIQDLTKESCIADKLMSSILDEHPSVGLMIVKKLLDQLEAHHLEIAEVLSESHQDLCPDWYYDAGKFHSALEAIKDIEL